jgi:uncharacterized protein (TIGR02147 family)
MNFSIFDFESPSLFLQSAWNKKRVFNKQFTLRAWAKQLGISSHGTFYQMVKGDRPLPKKYVRPITKSLNLGHKESLYLETLIDLSKANTNEHQVYYKERLQEIAPGNKLSFYEIATFEFLKNPINGAIIELTNLKDCEFDPLWIKNRLSIKERLSEVKKAIDLLLDLKLLTKDKFGDLKRSNEHIYTKQDIKNEALQEYHKNVLKLGADQITKQDVLKREYNATAMGIKSKDLPKIKEDIRDFLNDFIDKYEADSGQADEIYQLGIQLFGLTK